MTDERWRRLSDLFPQALALDPADRASFIRHHCPDDPELRDEFERLLGFDDQAERDGFLDPLRTTSNLGPMDDVKDREAMVGSRSGTRSAEYRRGPGDRIGKYEVVRPLGQGSQGSALLARDPDLQVLVVLKLYHAADLPEGQDPLLREGRALARVRHPNVARCLGIERMGELLVLVVEYIPGRDLSTHWREAPGTCRAAARVVEQLAGGLAAVHACGLLHRDIKPSNVILGDDGEPRLVDFGLAVALGSDTGSLRSGSPAYMAPEQARGEWERVDPRTDVFGLGAALYALLTGRPPYQAETSLTTLRQAEACQFPAPRQLRPSIPRRLERICLRAMSAAPERRYASAAELALALRLWRRPLQRLSVAATILVGALAVMVAVHLYLGYVTARQSQQNESLRRLLAQAESARVKASTDLQSPLKKRSGSYTIAPAPPTPTRAQGAGLAALDTLRPTGVPVPSAPMLGQTVSIPGNGAEHVGSVEGAVDRIATEIRRRLEQGRTLVIWAFDASGSLIAERERVSKHIDTVYTHLAHIDEQGLARNDGLLTMVLAFGRDRRAMTPEPIADKDEILSAIGAVPLDTSGVETTFQTVAEAVRRWRQYKDAEGHAYRAMVVVVTDEVGDDESYLEEAIDVANKARVPVYVLGSQAIFGRVEGYMDYTDPKTKHVFRHVPVRQGPESAMLEQVRLPYWYNGPQYETLGAGFGPYSLSRLAVATGGIYFVTPRGEGRMGFDPVVMLEYRPDWVSRSRYEANLSRDTHPIRHAVIEAARITQQQQLPGQPPLNFPAADGPEFTGAIAKAQEVAARIAYTVDAALEPVLRVAKQRDRETSRRWQAHFDLILGRLLAMKVRCYEYNWACAKMRKDTPKFHKPDSNAWRLVPDEQIHYSDKAAAAAAEAKSMLERVVEQHPGTPWALLAQRELIDPFGITWVETHVNPVDRPRKTAEVPKL
jgi:hypothetical protein